MSGSTHWGWDKMAATLADDILKCIYLKWNILKLIKISLQFVPEGPINKIPALVQIMAWCWLDEKMANVTIPTVYIMNLNSFNPTLKMKVGPWCNNMSAVRKRVISTDEIQFNHIPAKILLTKIRVSDLSLMAFLGQRTARSMQSI